MRACKSKRCKEQLETGWSYCPRCGKDNRPTEYRPAILNCAHRFEGPKKFCVVCGKNRSQAKAGNPSSIAFGKFLIKVGLVLIVASAAAWQIHSTGGGIGYSWVSPWYDQPLKLPGIGTLHGDDYPTWVGMLGLISAAFGGLQLVAAKLATPKKSRSKAKRVTPSTPTAPTV